jgi:hypothetical protein
MIIDTNCKYTFLSEYTVFHQTKLFSTGRTSQHDEKWFISNPEYNSFKPEN